MSSKLVSRIKKSFLKQLFFYIFLSSLFPNHTMELIDAALGIRIFQQTWWYPGSGSMIFLCGYSTFVFNYDQLKHLKLSKSPDTDEWLCFLALCIILTRNCVQKLAILQYNRSQLFYEVFP